MKEIATAFLLPPVGFLTLCLVGMVLGRRGKWAVRIGLVLLFITSLPVFTQALERPLESGLGLEEARLASEMRPQAIVVLGGEMTFSGNAAKPVTDVGPLTLERMRAAAHLQRKTGLPILVTAGDVLGPLMAQVMKDDFGITPRWVDTDAKDTLGNAKGSLRLLAPERFNTVYVVTNAWHMRRAMRAFSAAGLSVVPHTTMEDRFRGVDLEDFVPNPAYWLKCFYMVHEIIGSAYYNLRLYDSPFHPRLGNDP